ncbi:uncharacterized protein LOC130010766 [Patella vulgata]|uniref:uncharacterized protein LOC130010766 n=1 Tax=Patella vulgata TaxID=6465 RepID=UPI0024A841AE|nr:uncharacterized protein LOC130010766 [Patella vulgata]
MTNVLKLSNNEITHLSSSISHLRSLKVLHLDKNRLSEITETLVNCKQLAELNLSANCLQVLPSSLCSLIKLRILEVANNQLEHLPHDIGKLHDLRHLVLHDNKLWFLPFSITNFHKLWSLQLAGNLFDHIPMQVCQLTSLHTLNFARNRLMDVPSDFDSLRNLRELNLSHNRFTSVGTMIIRLEQLKYLNMSHNRLQALPVEMQRLRHLKVLHVQNNQIQSIADVFPNVQFLNLANNDLTIMSVSQMLKMVNLNISHNQLEVLPQGLSLLRNLKFLHLNKNLLREVTPDIVRLRKLETLDLSDNKLTMLPMVVYKIQTLKSFNIHGNNIAPLAPGTLEPIHRGSTEDSTRISDRVRIPDPEEPAMILQEKSRKSTKTYSENFIMKPHETQDVNSRPSTAPDHKSFSFFKRKAGKSKSKSHLTTDSRSHQTLSYSITKSKSKRQNNASWDLNKTVTSHASLETLPGLEEMKSYASPAMTRNHSESNLNMATHESMNILSTAEFQIDEIHADFSSEDEDFNDNHSNNSFVSKPSLQAITRRLVTADIPAYKSNNNIRESHHDNTGQWYLGKGYDPNKVESQHVTDYNLLGVCTELETMMSKKLLHPALILNTGLSKRFNEKVLKKTDDGLWRMSMDEEDDNVKADDGVYGIEYSPVETFTITENGGHYVSNYDGNIQVVVPTRAVPTTVHSTIQVLKINEKVLSQVQQLNRFANNVLHIGPIVMLQLLEEVNFDSQVKVTIPAPRSMKGHLILLTIQGDNSCIPSSSGYQYNRGLVTFNTWHFTRRVAIVTKAKCKYKACKSMEQILQCLGLVDGV